MNQFDEHNKFKVLFVDNSKTIRLAISNILKLNGYAVDTASSGTEALSMIISNNYDLAVIDLFMPTMNGYELAKKVRELPGEDKNSLPILALTSSTSDKDEFISKENGMTEFLRKTADSKNLLDALEKYKIKKFLSG